VSNPTLVGNVTPWAGFTLATIVERLLAAFGLTEDATTGRTVATADDSAQARVFIRRAFSMMNGRWPSIWSIRTVSATWTAGDHSVQLPTQCRSVLYVLWDGAPLTPITRDDELRNVTPNLSSGVAGTLKTGTGVKFYRTTGYVDGQTSPVLRLYATPTEAKTYEVCFNTLAPALTSDATALPVMAQFQEWVLAKAKELMASELGDANQKQLALIDLKNIETDLIPDTEAMAEIPHRFKWRYPNEAGRNQRGAGK